MMELWPSIHLIEASRVSNVYLLMGPPLTLIDTGPPTALRSLLAALREAGVDPQGVQRIVLTHCDVDHVGNARSLQRLAGAEVCAHEDDIPYITGEAPRPGPLMRRIIDATMGRRTNTLAVDRVLHDGDALDSLRVVHLPGHTPGHIGLQHESVLFAGDSVFGGRKLRSSPAILTWDRAQQRESLARMATLDVDLLLPGHGTPVNDGSRRCAELAGSSQNSGQ